MGLSLIIALLAFGIILILIEIFITPGFIVGVLGVVSMAVGLAYTYKEYGSSIGNIVLGSSLIFLFIVVVMAFRNGAWSRFAIKDQITGKANNIHELDVNLGDKGEALSALRPAGSAMINNQRFEVHTEGEFLLTHDKIEVVKMLNNKIFVRKINN